MRRLLWSVLILLYATPCLAEEEHCPYEWRFQLENDNFARRGEDQYYSGGWRFMNLSCARAMTWWAKADHGKGMFERMFKAAGITNPKATSFGYAFGQSIYTPTDIIDPDVRPLERPYGVWLYFGAIARAGNETDRFTLEIDVGWTGPPALGEEFQTFIHRHVVPARDPEGWSHQVAFEPGIHVWAIREHEYLSLRPWTGQRRRVFDLTGRAQLELGNIFSRASLGFVARIGYMQRGFVNLNNPALGQAGQASPAAPAGPAGPQGGQPPPKDNPVDGFEAFLYMAFDQRLVGRNVFLDGTLVRDSEHTIAKRALVPDFEIGAGLSAWHVRALFSIIWRGPEIEDPTADPSGHAYGQLQVGTVF